jgi:hypothetical protein
MHQFMFCGTWHGRRDLNGNGTGEIDERQRGTVGTMMPTKQEKCGVGDAKLSTST